MHRNNICHFCKKPGHIKPYCRQFKKFLEKQEQRENEKQEEENAAANTAQQNDEYALSIGNLKENELILDSGGTRHAFHDKNFFFFVHVKSLWFLL